MQNRWLLEVQHLQQALPMGAACPCRQGAQIEEGFFTALERVRAIHANCRALLAGAHQRAGLELMDAMAGYQETAYEHLCRYAPTPSHACRADPSQALVGCTGTCPTKCRCAQQQAHATAVHGLRVYMLPSQR